MKGLKFTTLFAASLLVVASGYAQTQGTPTEYLVSVSNVEFHKVGTPPGVFVPYAANVGNFDIASAAPFSNVGSVFANGAVQPGTYDQVRFLVSKTLTLTGSVGDAGDGLPCRTDTNGAVVFNPFGDGSVSQASLGSRDGGAGQPQSIVVPSGSAVPIPSILVSFGSSFRVTVPITFSVTTSVPIVTVRFNVTDSMLFIGIDPATCYVFPQAPGVSVSVGSSSFVA